MRETTKKWPAGHKRAGDGYIKCGDPACCPPYASKPKKLTQKQVEQQEAIDHLRKVLKPGDRVFGIVRTVSRSGMSRTIDFYAFGERIEHGKSSGCDRIYLSGYVATALDYRRDNSGALKVQGCGMDMIFHTVYNLSRTLFPDGFGLPCENGTVKGPMHWQEGYRPKTAQEAAEMVEAKAAFYGRNGDRSGWDEDGGYALKAESL